MARRVLSTIQYGRKDAALRTPGCAAQNIPWVTTPQGPSTRRKQGRVRSTTPCFVRVNLEQSAAGFMDDSDRHLRHTSGAVLRQVRSTGPYSAWQAPGAEAREEAQPAVPEDIKAGQAADVAVPVALPNGSARVAK
jgi:hypothetical protein